MAIQILALRLPILSGILAKEQSNRLPPFEVFKECQEKERRGGEARIQTEVMGTERRKSLLKKTLK